MLVGATNNFDTKNKERGRLTSEQCTLQISKVSKVTNGELGGNDSYIGRYRMGNSAVLLEHDIRLDRWGVRAFYRLKLKLWNTIIDQFSKK